MSKIKVGINGAGRIGRTILREWLHRVNHGHDLKLEIVALNNPGDIETYAHLIQYDSIHGVLKEKIEIQNDKLLIGNKTVKFFNQKDPSEIDWSSLGVQVVIDATGKFKDKPGLGLHLKGTVKKVIMCAPGKDLDGTFVMGINHTSYNTQSHHIISNASCTTNCLAPVAKVLEENFGIQQGFMTTVHAYTQDQNLLDGNHSDTRRARAAAMNMIPTTTGAAKALGEVIPSLKGKLDGYAVRVPTPDVSMVDLTVELKKKATKAEINQAMAEAAAGPLKGILAYENKELVSLDFKGRPESSIFDAPLTNVINNSVKIVSWYDNEVGFSNRVLDLALYVGERI